MLHIPCQGGQFGLQARAEQIPITAVQSVELSSINVKTVFHTSWFHNRCINNSKLPITLLRSWWVS